MSISFVIVISLWYRNNFIANIYLILLTTTIFYQFFLIGLQNNVKFVANCHLTLIFRIAFSYLLRRNNFGVTAFS